jgi:hypothetical protein
MVFERTFSCPDCHLISRLYFLDFIPSVLDHQVVDKWVKTKDKGIFLSLKKLIELTFFFSLKILSSWLVA